MALLRKHRCTCPNNISLVLASVSKCISLSVAWRKLVKLWFVNVSLCWVHVYNGFAGQCRLTPIDRNLHMQVKTRSQKSKNMSIWEKHREMQHFSWPCSLRGCDYIYGMIELVSMCKLVVVAREVIWRWTNPRLLKVARSGIYCSTNERTPCGLR